ncbi:Uu.00g061040.m01.CDS01 [Anthostomella pinea]|uniref:Uu.00g061040.m01.CDS01 n=1 Tax=Anthostomella pinea TaxID=933095 RepID=A0AAI8YMJ3_9PEZI|nr:Uu.00g061040.m01.CDS01 [Anthostomella pinea]
MISPAQESSSASSAMPLRPLTGCRAGLYTFPNLPIEESISLPKDSLGYQDRSAIEAWVNGDDDADAYFADANETFTQEETNTADEFFNARSSFSKGSTFADETFGDLDEDASLVSLPFSIKEAAHRTPYPYSPPTPYPMNFLSPYPTPPPTPPPTSQSEVKAEEDTNRGRIRTRGRALALTTPIRPNLLRQDAMSWTDDLVKKSLTRGRGRALTLITPDRPTFPHQEGMPWTDDLVKESPTRAPTLVIAPGGALPGVTLHKASTLCVGSEALMPAPQLSRRLSIPLTARTHFHPSPFKGEAQPGSEVPVVSLDEAAPTAWNREGEGMRSDLLPVRRNLGDGW